VPRGVSRYDDARLQQQLWTPKCTGALTARFDAGAGSFNYSGGMITTWGDLSPFGNNLGVSGFGGSTQPDFQASGWNPGTVSKPATLWTGPSIGMSLASQISASAISVFCAFENVNTGASVLCLTGSALGGLQFRLFLSAGNYYLQVVKTHTAVVQTSAIALPLGFNIGGTAQTSGGGSSIWTNGALETASGTSYTNPLIAAIGFDYRGVSIAGPYSPYTGLMGEMLIFSKEVSSAEANAINGYLAWKWGMVSRLPAGHPFKNRPPLIGD